MPKIPKGKKKFKLIHEYGLKKEKKGEIRHRLRRLAEYSNRKSDKISGLNDGQKKMKIIYIDCLIKLSDLNFACFYFL